MKYLNVILIFIISVSVSLYAKNNYIVQYENLYKDLLNFKTYGYKSKFYNNEFAQGSIEQTKIPTNFAILGEGFFRLKTNVKDKYVYTRNGKFYIDEDRNLVTQNGYILDINTKIPENYIVKTISIKDNCLLIFIIDSENVIKIPVVLYKISNKNSNDGIYYYSENALVDENSKIFSGFLENSTTLILPTLIEMKFVLSDIKNEKIKFLHIDEKIELINYAIEFEMSINSSSHISSHDFLSYYLIYLDKNY